MEILWLWLLMATLATFRMAELLVNEEGPGAVFLRLRMLTGMYDYGDDGEPYANANALQRTLGGLLNCVFCAGVWCALLTTLAMFVMYGFQLPLVFYAVFWLATAGGQAVLETVLQAKNKG